MTDGPTRLTSIMEILLSGEFSRFVGMAEDPEFECKRAPYHLDELGHRLEMVKDVAAFANTIGGAIVLGLDTSKVPEKAADVVERIRGFSRDRFSIQRCEAIINEHVYPLVAGLRVEWYPSSGDPAIGIGAIIIPRQQELRQPFLVRKLLDTDGRVRGTSIGYFERFHDDVMHRDVKDFYYLIQAGRARHELDARLSSLEAKADNGASPWGPSELSMRIAEAISLAGLTNHVSYALIASPSHLVSIPQLFTRQHSPIRALIQSPPSIRYGGFEVDAGGSARIVEGKLLRAVHPESHRILELWRDGMLIFVGPGDTSFLCWGKRPAPPFIINPVALLESLYLFCALAREVQQYTDPTNCGVDVLVELRQMTGDQRVHLPAGWIDGSAWIVEATRHPAPATEVSLKASWLQGQIEPRLLAFRAAAKIYEWFGIAHDQIPYVIGVDNERAVDFEAISQL